MVTRPAALRGDAIGWIGAASCAGALLVAFPLATAAVVVFGTWLRLRLRQGGSLLVVLSYVALGCGAVRAHGVIDSHERSRSAVIDSGAWPSRCTAVGTVVRSPTFLGGGLRLVIDAKEAHCRDGPPLAGRVALHLPLGDGDPALAVARGDEVSVTASLAPPYRFWNDDVGDPRPGFARRGVVLSGGAEDVVVTRRGVAIASVIDRARIHLRDRIVATFPLDTAAMARALVLGEDDLPDDDQRAFRQSGLAHLLAVSGMHLVLVVMGFVAALRALLVRIPLLAARTDVMRIASAIGLPAAWLYAELAGGSGSAIRAAWMCSVTLLARALGRRTAAWRALGLSLLTMSILDPLVAFDVSFVLSALATAGLLALSRPIEAWLSTPIPIVGRSLPPIVAKPLSTTAAATVACAPVLASMAPELPLSGLVANIVAVPLGEAAALPLCLVHGVLSVWPAAERGSATAASGALVLVRAIARGFTWGGLPVPPPTPAQLAAIVATAIAVAFARSRRGWFAAGALTVVALELSTRLRGSPRGALRVTFIDVGQGDSALVDLPDGSALLVDAGGLVGSPIDVGERAVSAVLTARRRSAVDIVMLSHPHPDHFLGFEAALEGRRVGAFWDTGQGEAEGAAGPYARVLSDLRSRGTEVVRPSALCGARNIGGAVIEVLAPCPGLAPDRGANDNSFVVRIRFGERAVLFVGDAEREEEAELVERLGESGGLRADVLKVGHHGSRTSSSPAFLAAVRPSVAVISCGVRNRFGHPHPSTVATLGAAVARTFRTDRDGSVVATSDGHALDVRTMTE